VRIALPKIGKDDVQRRAAIRVAANFVLIHF